MRRSDHPSRPSAITCCRFSALKTLAIPAAGVQPTAHVNVLAPGAALAGFQMSINGRFWVSTEASNGTVAAKMKSSGRFCAGPSRPSNRRWRSLRAGGIRARPGRRPARAGAGPTDN